jgi:hypothetical protein
MKNPKLNMKIGTSSTMGSISNREYTFVASKARSSSFILSEKASVSPIPIRYLYLSKIKIINLLSLQTDGMHQIYKFPEVGFIFSTYYTGAECSFDYSTHMYIIIFRLCASY